VTPPAHAQSVRAIALELERMACHTGDLGALADAVGYLPTANFCGRLRGDFLNATGTICGNRFGRSLVRPGGVNFEINADMATTLSTRLKAALRDVEGAAKLLWDSLSVRARFENTGVVSSEDAQALGIVGMALRATGIKRDVRQDFPTGAYVNANYPAASWPTGDVFARAYVRSLEIELAGKFVLGQLAVLPSGPSRVEMKSLAPDAFAVSMIEGWRGPVCHTAITDSSGKFARYKVVDPSFQNWTGLMLALRDQQISDFPLCNKSFNLSYCGHDL
jgi:Ni,Fe-hydrogenase III large subunit